MKIMYIMKFYIHDSPSCIKFKGSKQITNRDQFSMQLILKFAK